MIMIKMEKDVQLSNVLRKVASYKLDKFVDYVNQLDYPSGFKAFVSSVVGDISFNFTEEGGFDNYDEKVDNDGEFIDRNDYNKWLISFSIINFKSTVDKLYDYYLGVRGDFPEDDLFKSQRGLYAYYSDSSMDYYFDIAEMMVMN